MNTPTQQLFDGSLLGDIVESITGHDLTIARSLSHHEAIQGGYLTRCSHRTRAYAGQSLLGTAYVVWEGTATYYAKLLTLRMRNYLKSHKAHPVIKSYDSDKGILVRHFMIETPSGFLHIHEKIFMLSVALLINSYRS